MFGFFLMLFLLSVEALHLHAELFRQYGIEEDAYECSDGKSGEVDAADGNTVIGTIFHTDSEDKDEGCHKDIARTGEVNC